MSSDYYFKKWRETIRRIEELVHLDQHFQNTKVHDKKRCEAVIRLCGIIGEYIVLYNDAMECWQQNLQVQKTSYMGDVVRAVTNRILELKHDVRKLEYSDTQFMSHGLANHKLTTFDAELDDVPTHVKRPAHVDAAIAEAFRKAEEHRELLRIAAEEIDKVETGPVDTWWDEEVSPDEDESALKVDEEPETEEMIQKRQMVTVIQAQERARQLILSLTQIQRRRERWDKELRGTLKPPARLELRERGSKIIQKALRAYFEIKRKKKKECERDDVLGIRLCRKANKEAVYLANQTMNLRSNQRKQFEHQWIKFRAKLKEDYEERRKEDIADDYRDFINAWFRKWFDEIKYFYDVPKEDEGGSSLIMKYEKPEPIEWWESYKLYQEEKKANKNKSAQQLKFEQQEAKLEGQMNKKEEQMKKKLEEKMMQKLMKNPTMHPGFTYPESKRTDHILEVIENYKKAWDDLDHTEILEVKKKFVPNVDMNELYAEVKMDLMRTVDDDMRNEIKVLKKALKKDYANNEEDFPEPMKKRRKRANKKQKVKAINSEHIAEKLEELVLQEILKEYPQRSLGDFLGDHNFAGDDMRCNYEPAPHFSGETRGFWWERCREATHGYHKILVVGPPLSGKTVLVHALASVTDAVLFDLEASNLKKQASSTGLQRLLNTVLVCAKAAQPSVIHIKHINRFYYKKVPPEEANMRLDVMKSLITKMLKKINKADRIAVIGTCVDPWLTKSSPMLNQFPAVVLVPNMSYSAVFRLLNCWMSENHFLPRNLDIHSLAFVLRGYSYGYIEKSLKEFLSPEQIIRIAARGLNPMEIYDYFLDRDTEKVDYEKYLKWYYEKTHWGKKEAKHIEEQREFKRLTERYLEKGKKKTAPVSAASATSLRSAESSDEEQY